MRVLRTLARGGRVVVPAAEWFVYIVRCADRTLYTGVTRDASRRLAEHNAGRGARYTRSRRPVDLVYVESAPGRGAALRRESEIKRMRAEAKRRLIRDSSFNLRWRRTAWRR